MKKVASKYPFDMRMHMNSFLFHQPSLAITAMLVFRVYLCVSAFCLDE